MTTLPSFNLASKLSFAATQGTANLIPHAWLNIRTIGQNEIEESSMLIAERFCKDESLSKGLGFTPSKLARYFTYPIAKLGVKSGLSIIAREKNTEKIAGVILALPEDDVIDFDAKLELERNIPEEVLIFSDILQQVKYGFEFKRAVNLYMVATSKEFLNRKVVTNLFQTMPYLSMSKGYCSMLVETTVPYSRRACKNLGFETKNFINYKDYKYNGKKVFKEDDGGVAFQARMI